MGDVVSIDSKRHERSSKERVTASGLLSILGSVGTALAMTEDPITPAAQVALRVHLRNAVNGLTKLREFVETESQ